MADPVETPGPGFVPTADMVNSPDKNIRASQVANLAKQMHWMIGVLNDYVQRSTTGTYAPADASYVTTAPEPLLSAEHVLTAGPAISKAVGAGTVTLKAISSPTDSGTVVGTGRHIAVPAEMTGSGYLSGDLGFDYANENANKVFAGPTSGGAARPTFRSLVVADLPAPYIRNATVFSVGIGSAASPGEVTSADVAAQRATPYYLLRAGAGVGFDAAALHTFGVFAVDVGGVGDVYYELWNDASSTVVATVGPVGGGGAGLYEISFSPGAIGPGTGGNVIFVRVRRTAGPAADAKLYSWYWNYEL